jgi:hypothetical protein
MFLACQNIIAREKWTKTFRKKMVKSQVIYWSKILEHPVGHTNLVTKKATATI